MVSVTSHDFVVFLNGEFLPLENANISVMDRGFLFGDGVYEVIPVYENWIFRLDEHLVRLQNSLNEIDIVNPYTQAEWEQLIRQLMEKNDFPGDKSIYIQVTRGVITPEIGGRDHFYNKKLVPTVLLMCKPITSKDFSKGVGAITHEDIRWDYCHIKAISLLPGVLLKNRAFHKDGSYEAILLQNGKVTEGAASNVFIVKDKVIKTPLKDNKLLSGVTRDLIIELIRKAEIPYEETTISEAELRKSDEIWITSSTMEIAPVIKLDGQLVGGGEVGPMWYEVNALYQNFKSNGPYN